jgi:uncharacterized membrane protein
VGSKATGGRLAIGEGPSEGGANDLSALLGEPMTMIAGYIATLVAFGGVDMVWLGLMVQRLYRPALGELLAPDVNLPAAIAFYLLFPLGLMIFAVLPAAKSQSLGDATLFGALFGLFGYATYDLTNQATLRGWPVQLTLIDIAWGVALSGFAATIGWLVAHRLAPA